SDAPIAGEAAVSLNEDGAHFFCAADFGFADVDGDELVQVIITSLPANGVLMYADAVVTGDDLAGGGLAVAAGNIGLLSFVPDADFNGGLSFTYRLKDSGDEGANLSEE